MTDEPAGADAVERAMELVAADDTPDNRAALFRLLLAATLLAATTDATRDETDLVTFEGEDGPVLPSFTRPETLLRWRPSGSGSVELGGRALFELAAAKRTGCIWLNLGSETAGVITRRELEALARGRLPLGEAEVVAAASEVRVGRAPNPPGDDVLGAVRAALGAEGAAVAAWLFVMQQGENAPELVVGVELTGGADAGAAMRAVVDGAGDRSREARELLFMALDGGLLATIAAGSGDEIFRRQ